MRVVPTKRLRHGREPPGGGRLSEGRRAAGLNWGKMSIEIILLMAAMLAAMLAANGKKLLDEDGGKNI